MPEPAVPPRRPQGIVPPWLIQRLVDHPSERVAQVARHTLRADAAFRSEPRPGLRSLGGALPRASAPTGPAAPDRRVSDARNGTQLPGEPVRAEGGPATGDAAADEAYDGLGSTWELFWSAFGRNALDGVGGPLLATVHYGESYDNAFWDGTQMVFGDGDGEVFNRFTLSLDVIGHELAHGVTERTAQLVYQGQAGALNESVSDVFGSLVRQQVLGQTADQADWLIGADLFTDQVQGVALRSMKAPGTAYDDDVLGKDPQPATMADYVETSEDNGGVHINSGIPNHAFYLAATAIGGQAWEAPGQIWYDVLTGGRLPADADFEGFAALTVEAATARFGAGSVEAEAVAGAWEQVGVAAAPSAPVDVLEPVPLGPGPIDPVPTPGPTPSEPFPPGPSQPVPSPDPTPGEPMPSGDPAPVPPAPPSGPAPDGSPGPQHDPGEQPVELIRSGGVAGTTRRARFVPNELDPPDAAEWRTLLVERSFWIDLPAPEATADDFTYRVIATEVELDTTFGERALPDPVRGLVHRTLRHGG
ncbi:protealysin inhibitor emfourin [Auraticoccus monumenti]|uniref:Neutral metalloproteinase n=1 Tax=Auraticoccus monumenti TaxID=675864 RepID=A0A1G7F0L0_9ACTN|nr:protealysin inhibitor emfourin [Auraticoccus monumenti]SDE69483.1 Thermolysin metallopeptidase, catalytic domain [Auraticoccus monumenti]